MSISPADLDEDLAREEETAPPAATALELQASTSLIGLGHQLRTVHQALEQSADPETGEIPDTAIMDTLTRLEMAIVDKARACISYSRGLRMSSESLREEARRLSDRAKALKRAEDRFREYLAICLNTMRKRKIIVDGHSVRIQKSQSLVIDNEAEIPAEFRRTTIKNDYPKIPIKEAMKAGAVVPGVHIEEKETAVIS